MANDTDDANKWPQPPPAPDGKKLPSLSAEDAARLEVWFQENRKALERYLTARLGSRQEAVDMAQETYVRVARGMTRVRVPNLSGFMFSTANNLVRNKYRQRKQRGAKDISMAFTAQEDATLDELLYSQQERAALRKAVSELAPEQREALLKYKYSFTYTELAEHLGIHSRTVRRRVRRALEEIRRKMVPGGSK